MTQVNAQQSNGTISVFAGNPKIDTNENGEFIIEPHLTAFEEAMKFVHCNRERIGRIYIAVDHIGKFHKRFVSSATSIKKSKKPNLEVLHSEIRSHFEPLATKYGVSLSDIHIITEGAARAAMLQNLNNMNSELRSLVTKSQEGCLTNDCKSDSEDERPHINCVGITAEIYRRLGRYGNEIRSFWEYDEERCKPETIEKGAKVAQELLGVRAKITNTIIFSEEYGGGTLDREYEVLPKSHLEHLVDFKTLKIKLENLTERQRQFAHLIDPRFFEGGTNPFRKDMANKNYVYITPVELEEELFYLHPFMDPLVLEQGNVRRFPAGINEKYIAEKYFEDKWVAEGNDELSKRLEAYIEDNLEELRQKDKIKVLDIGPCGGAITTLFALRAFDRYGLLDKVEIALLDIVPNVLEATKEGKFNVPNEMIKEYELDFAGENAKDYKAMLASDASARYYCGDGEVLPDEVKEYDVVLSAYTHHHMNFLGRISLSEQMEQAARKGGFVGVADFYAESYEDYMKWYKPHFEQYGDAPPVECPMVSGQQLAGWFKNTQINEIKDMQKSFVFSGIKK